MDFKTLLIIFLVCFITMLIIGFFVLIYAIIKIAKTADKVHDQAFAKYLQGLTTTSGCPVKKK